jgi:hypothetical protein
MVSEQKAATLGLRPGTLDRINGQIRTHVTVARGWAGHKLNAFKLDK